MMLMWSSVKKFDNPSLHHASLSVYDYLLGTVWLLKSEKAPVVADRIFIIQVALPAGLILFFSKITCKIKLVTV